MGQQAKLTRKRREMRNEVAARMKTVDAELRERPDIQAVFAAGEADEELQALLKADSPDQKQRLRAAGWKRVLAAPDGLGVWDHPRSRLRLVHSVARQRDGKIWGQVSLSSEGGDLPGWYPLRNAQWLVYPGCTGLVVVAPESRHVNLSQAAHVWTCLDGDVIPDFGWAGTI
jgi:hypothetical protein